MADNILTSTPSGVDFVADFDYPATAQVLSLTGNPRRHLIFTNVNVASVLTATDGTGFGNAPVGTVIFQFIAGTAQIHMKETDATWTSK